MPALSQARGGTPYTVPKHLRSGAGTRLVDLVGADAAAALAAELPGETLQLPKYDGVLRQLRHQRVLDLRAKGTLLADIALATGYSQRQVINILHDGDMQGAPVQADLFGP